MDDKFKISELERKIESQSEIIERLKRRKKMDSQILNTQRRMIKELRGTTK